MTCWAHICASCVSVQGLYRDALMSMPDTVLGAAKLFVRLAVGSRTLFWLVLAGGYQLPPHLQVSWTPLSLIVGAVQLCMLGCQ